MGKTLDRKYFTRFFSFSTSFNLITSPNQSAFTNSHCLYCEVCPRGQYASGCGNSLVNASPGICTDCMAGTFSSNNETAVVSCSLCEEGKYSDVAGASECKVCDTGTYVHASGATSCEVEGAAASSTYSNDNSVWSYTAAGGIIVVFALGFLIYRQLGAPKPKNFSVEELSAVMPVLEESELRPPEEIKRSRFHVQEELGLLSSVQENQITIFYSFHHTLHSKFTIL